MANNVAVTAGSGTIVAAEELTDGSLGACKVQFVKLMDGTITGTSKAAVGANGLSVDVKASVAIPITDNSGSLTVDGTVAATQSGTWTVQPGNTANTTAWLTTAGHGKTQKFITGAASATATIVAAVSAKRIKVYALEIMTSSTTAVTVTFKSAAGGTALRTYTIQAPTGTIAGVANAVTPSGFLFATVAGELLELAFSAAQTVTYNISYFDDDAT